MAEPSEGATAETTESPSTVLAAASSDVEQNQTTEQPEVTEGESAEDAEEKPQGAPEEYEQFVMPEGIAATAEDLNAAAEIFKGLDLTQEQAQALVNFEAERMSAAETARIEAEQQEINRWVSEIKTDPTIGGRNFQTSMAVAARAVDRFGGERLREALNSTGAGNNPAVVRAFYEIGRLIQEDAFGSTGDRASNAEPKPLHERIYGTG
jgi:hypothetical protein